MKKLFQLICIFLSLPLGVIIYLLFPYYYNRPEEMKKIPSDIELGIFTVRLEMNFLDAFQNLPESFLIKLHEHIPALFSTERACIQTISSPEGSYQKIVFAGTRIPNNSELICFDNSRVKAAEQSNSFLTMNYGDLPSHLVMYYGSAELTFSNPENYVSTRWTTISAKGQGNTAMITASDDNSVGTFLCISGNMQIQVLKNILNGDKYTFIGNVGCNLEITGLSGQKRSVNPGEKVRADDINIVSSVDPGNHVANLSNEKPQASPISKNQANTSAIQIKIAPKGSKGDILNFSYTLPMNGPAVCNLKTGASENGPFSDAYQFQAPSKSGTLDLQKGFSAFFLSLHCTDGKNKFLSNVIPPKK